MHALVAHALPRAHLAPHLVYERAEERDDPHAPARLVMSHVEALPGQDELGRGVTLHRPAAWRCRCQRDLALDFREVAGAWALHAARAVKIRAETLEAHMLVDVAGRQAVATCACGRTFRAPDEDPTNGDAAVQGWAEHVAEAAS